MNPGATFRIRQLSLLFIVSDLNETITFYVGILDFALEFRYEDFYLGLVKDGFSIHFKSGEVAIDKRTIRKQNMDIDITLSVENIESLYNTLLTKSIDLVQPLREMPYGREFYIADPDGYIISFLD